ncbi:MAG: glycosyltransferase family 9 protein [Candidatus Gastranaerophilales bacterium]|nr:glycosyltransferase family 9 protein [Candidatus Gastranaerophilales bacterium]
MNNNDIKKILLINFGGIGDEILFFPTIKSVKQTYPNAKIYLALESRSKSAKQLCSYIDEVICVNIKSKYKYFEVLKFLFKVWQENFDVVFSSGSSNLVSVLLFLTGIKQRYGFKAGKLSEKLLTKTIPLNKKQYAASMYHDLIKIVNHDAVCDIPEIDDVEVPQTYTDKPIILIHPGVSQMSIAKNIIKGWSVKRWAKLIDLLLETKQYKVMLAGGKDDEETIEQILLILNATRTDYTDFQNMYGQTKNLKDFISLIKMSSLMVCVDSAPLHMAIATDTPVVAIFGPTNEEVLVPKRNNIVVMKNENINCRPCLWDKRQTSCETKECLEIHTKDVFDAIEGLLVK